MLKIKDIEDTGTKGLDLPSIRYSSPEPYPPMSPSDLPPSLRPCAAGDLLEKAVQAEYDKQRAFFPGNEGCRVRYL